MRLRPATPLAIAFFIAFILLLISTLSTPIIKAIPLAVYGEFRFGVLGYCGPDKFCSSPTVRYNIDINGGGDDGDFTLAEPARHSLSSILIVHPIAAFLTLICTIMAVSAHFHSPSHSAPFLLWLLILSFPTLLITLLAFLVDILLFVPHLAWGGWIVLGSTILISCCSVLTCAMRRTLVSRKARKKRIAEDDDMNGTNSESVYHATSQPRLVKETEGLATSDSQYTRAESPPPLDGAAPANGSYRGGDKGPAFATYDMNRSQRPSTDDRVPLNPNRDPSIRTTSSHGRRGRPRDLQRGDSDRNGYGGDGRVSPVSPMEYDGAAGGYYGHPSDNRHRGGSNRGRGGAPPYYSQSRGGYPPQRGSYGHRGGYPTRGGPGARGGYPPRGGMYPPRGGPNGMQGPPPGGWRDDINMGPIAAGAGAGAVAGGAMMGRGQRGPPSYDNEPYPPYSNQHQPQNTGYNDYAGGNPYDEPQQPAYRQPTPPSTINPATAYPNTAALYGLDTNVPTPSQDHRGPSSRSGTPTSATNNADTIISPRGPASFGFSGRQPSPSRSRSQSRHREETAAANAPLPPLPTQPSNNAALPIGQAIEMDASSGSPAMSPQGGDGNVISPIGAAIGDIQRGFGPNDNNAPSRTGTSHSHHSHHNSQAVELPGHAITTHTASPAPSQQQRQESRHRRASSDAYYEDVPAAFAASSDPVANQHSPILTSPTHPPTVEQLQAQEAQRQRQQQQQQGGNGMLPASLTPGAYLPPTGTAVRSGSRGANEAPASNTRPTLSSENSQSSFYNDGPGSGPAPMSSHHLGVGPGAGVNRTTSPSAASESSSAYTSVSQRGVNPAYYEQYQSQGQGQGQGGGYGYGQGQGQGYGYAQGVDRQRRPQQAVLDSNPDFGVGGANNKGRRGHARGASGDGEGRYPAV